MNLQFAANRIHIHATADEFQQLCDNRTLTLDVPLPHGHAFRAKLNTISSSDWLCESDPTGLWLSMPRRELRELAAAQPGQVGLVHHFDTQRGDLEISFEVDDRPN